MSTSDGPVRGGCLCGAVRFEVARFAGPFEICHCNRCRKVTGAAGAPTIGVDRDDFRLLQGADHITAYAAPLLHGPPAYQVHFCRICGSPVPPPEPEAFLEIAAGLLDDDPGVRPDKHIFVEHTPGWDRITDGLPTLTAAQIIAVRRQGKR